MSNDYGPSIPIARLFERTSKKGNTYLVGRLGLAKVAILKSEETTDEGTPIWNVLISEASPSNKPEHAGDNNVQEARRNRPRAREARDGNESARRDWQRPADEPSPDIPF